jgi:hypothetical protein
MLVALLLEGVEAAVHLLKNQGERHRSLVCALTDAAMSPSICTAATGVCRRKNAEFWPKFGQSVASRNTVPM